MEDLHDNIGHNLTSIKRLSDSASLKYLSSDPCKMEEIIKGICNLSRESMDQLRNFLWVIDLEYNTWEDLTEWLP